MVGQNCHFDYTTSLKTIELMKAELEKEGLSPYLMMQPPGYHVPDAKKGGMPELPEYPFGTKRKSSLVFSEEELRIF